MNTTTNETDDRGATLPVRSLQHDNYYADRGRGWALLNMARRHATGDEVEIDLNKARVLYVKAVAAGMAVAGVELAKLGK